MNYKHWGKRYHPAEESICIAPGCMQGGVEFERGQVKCSRHLSLRLEVTRGYSSETAYGRMQGIRRLGDQN